MPNLPISLLPTATTASGSDLLAIVQGGVTKKLGYSFLLSSFDAAGSAAAAQAAAEAASQPLNSRLTTISGGTDPFAADYDPAGAAAAAQAASDPAGSAAAAQAASQPTNAFLTLLAAMTPNLFSVLTLDSAGSPVSFVVPGSGVWGLVVGVGGVELAGADPVGAAAAAQTAAELYSAGNPSDWETSPPALVALALDRLAAWAAGVSGTLSIPKP